MKKLSQPQLLVLVVEISLSDYACRIVLDTKPPTLTLNHVRVQSLFAHIRCEAFSFPMGRIQMEHILAPLLVQLLDKDSRYHRRYKYLRRLEDVEFVIILTDIMTLLDLF